MKKYFLIIAITFLSLNIAFSQVKDLSDKAQISLITIEPGQNELYAAFGHSGIRVYDPIRGIDFMYNYGIFDFNQPNFYLNFARGYLLYKLGGASFPAYVNHYSSRENRTVKELPLKLTPGQAEAIHQYLKNNIKPENQNYYYDYYYNNCATKVYDVFAEVLGEQLQTDWTFIDTDLSFRESTNDLLAWQPWGSVGINLGLGMPIDKKMTPREYTYLPEYVEKAFLHSQVNGQKMADSDNLIIHYTRNEELAASEKPGFFTPMLVFWVIFGIIFLITLTGYRDYRWFKFIDVIWFFVLGLVGLLLTFLWFFTDHHAAENNLNILWAWPTHLIFAFLLLKKSYPTYLRRYFLICGWVMILIALLWGLLPQQYHPSFLPIILVSIVRCFYIYLITTKREGLQIRV
ncbi:lipoprotein N-acyltransferase Lnb domain-containing protein [Marinigracilibium pacificum]|uniref:DUF4105 domain-containing protein n=1 Tax=Marinigracilibium pacificum TaxID=2729599 RepID=A0A848IR05_9BACT|nr:DUF4105 domain-containing protein [Marinigracilibium pacificum]NMM46787.1 DUF4105 domain-containing protein [Marinigracilibium pacificum]